VEVKFDTTADVLRLSGSGSMAIADFISGSATLSVEKTTSGDTTTPGG
jgi:23S rRNA G2445 N2-methylase RlmL